MTENDNKKPIVISKNSKKEEADKIKEEELKEARRKNIERLFDNSNLPEFFYKIEFGFFLLFMLIYSLILEFIKNNNLNPTLKIELYLKSVFNNDISSAIIMIIEIATGVLIFMFLLKIYNLFNKKSNDKTKAEK